MRRQAIRYFLLSVVVLLGVVGIVIVIWTASGWMARTALLRKMLGEGSYTLTNDPATQSLVRDALPQLLEIHGKAVAECGRGKMVDPSRMDAFNRRIKSWHAILMAVGITHDATGIAYVEAFIHSDAALPEEVDNGKIVLRQVSGRQEKR